MRVLILLSLIFPLAAGPLARNISARVEPRLGTWLMTGAALLLAGTSCGALGLLVLSPLVRTPWVARLGHWSSTIVADAGLPGGWTSLVAAMALGAALLAATAFTVRRGRALAEARRHARALPGPGELVVTRDAAAYAYAVPGQRRGQRRGLFGGMGKAAAGTQGITGHRFGATSDAAAGTHEIAGQRFARTEDPAVRADAFDGRRFGAIKDAAAGARAFSWRRMGGDFDVAGDVAAAEGVVAGRPGRIVVSAGMLDVLDEHGRAALLAHERAHLTGRHHWFIGVARLAAAANPLVKPLASAVEYAVERWADESAAAAVGDRQVVARAIAKAAVAAKATSGRAAARLGALGVTGSESGGRGVRGLGTIVARIFTGDDGGLAGAGPVPRRVAALLAPAPTTRRGMPVLVVSLFFLGVAALCALQAADHLQDLISFAHDARVR